MIRAVLLSLALVAGAQSVSETRELKDSERAELVEIITRFTLAFESGDVARIFSMLPPGILEHIAEESGMNMDELLAVASETFSEVMDAVTVDFFEMDLSGAEYRETPDGTPYVLIPTTVRMKTAEIPMTESISHTLALLDRGEWRLLRVSDFGHLSLLRRIYPSFKGVEVPRGSMTVVE